MDRIIRVVPTWALRSIYSSIADLHCHIDRINKKIGTLMSNQETLDGYVTELNTAVGVIASEIQALKDQLANQPTEVPVDFSGLDAAVHAVEALEPPVMEEPPVEETPEEPVV